jgi:hypothetical protein
MIGRPKLSEKKLLHFYLKSHMDFPCTKPSLRGQKQATNRLNYGRVLIMRVTNQKKQIIFKGDST